MCENDAAVDAYIVAVYKWSSEAASTDDVDTSRYLAAALRAGYFQGVVRELAATVPGVREWLIANMPKGEG